MSSQNYNNPSVPEMDLSLVNNQEINIDCENFNNNNDAVRVNNGSSNMNSSHNRNQSGNSGMANSSSAHTLFESTADNTSYRVVRSYREYAAQFLSSDESDNLDSNSDITGSGTTSNTDDTSVNSDFVQTKKNTFDLYRDQSGSNLKNSIIFDIEKSKTVKSSSTTSSKTVYKNPTLSSVVNQNLQNSSFDKNYFDQQYEDLKMKKKEHKKVDPQLKLQKMVLNVPETYDIPTRDKKIFSQRILNITLVIMVIIATTLLALYIYLKVNHGYSYPHIKDINDGNRTKMIFISLFMYLAVAIGFLGSALNWKSILVTYTVFCTLNALALGYLVYGVYDDTYKHTQLPFAWWDTYSANTRRSLQDEFFCCGFKEPLDGGEISRVCAKEAVVWNVPYETIYDNFSVLKKDATAKELNVTVVGKKNKETTTVLPTPIIDQTPTPILDATSVNRTLDDNVSVPVPTVVPTTEDTSSPSTNNNSQKRAFEIEEEEDLEVVSSSSLFAKNIYNILDIEEVEEENDARPDQDISSIRVLNKRVYVQETYDEYQYRTNATNPDINMEKVQNTNYTSMTPEESRAYAKANGLEGCEPKLQAYIHKNLTPVFYVLVVFFCLYLITIPMALIFLFKLRRIPSINEFE